MQSEQIQGSAIHPQIKQALTAVELPEVQAIIRRLSDFGLAVSLPHMHTSSGSFLPLPDGVVSFESDLSVSFLNSADTRIQDAIPVAWRWDDGIKAVGNCALCDFYVHPGK